MTVSGRGWIGLLGLGVLQQYSEMHLLPEPLFSVPTDGVHVMSIEATQHGRIFLAGKDGCLYELAYQVHLCHGNCTMIVLDWLAWSVDTVRLLWCHVVRRRRVSVGVSVFVCVTRQYCIKMARITQTTPYDSWGTIVF